jgi:hypothetical protein
MTCDQALFAMEFAEESTIYCSLVIGAIRVGRQRWRALFAAAIWLPMDALRSTERIRFVD